VFLIFRCRGPLHSRVSEGWGRLDQSTQISSQGILKMTLFFNSFSKMDLYERKNLSLAVFLMLHCILFRNQSPAPPQGQLPRPQHPHQAQMYSPVKTFFQQLPRLGEENLARWSAKFKKEPRNTVEITMLIWFQGIHIQRAATGNAQCSVSNCGTPVLSGLSVNKRVFLECTYSVALH
jgi:hypothetical protein